MHTKFPYHARFGLWPHLKHGMHLEVLLEFEFFVVLLEFLRLKAVEGVNTPGIKVIYARYMV